ncbi:MAG: sigma-70 family RNA polymerase sigma factor [Firmicutes bacterium]|nr:sigma-70 family RNA polymerase sigma factor [Bacillota bacterium]
MQQRLLSDLEAIKRAQHDSAALEALAGEMHDLVWSCYWRHFGNAAEKLAAARIEKEDLFQSGMIGCMKALRRFDPDRGTAFSTYAMPYIEGFMFRAFRDGQLIRPWRGKDGRRDAIIVSLDAPLAVNKHGEELPLGETLAVDEDWEDIVTTQVDMTRAVSDLHPRVAEIVRLRAKGLGQTAIAAKVGCSQAQVSRSLAAVRERGGFCAS